MLCNKSYLLYEWEFTKSYIMNAGGDLHDSWGHILPGLSRIVMAYPWHSNY